jgi:hypothetical protein
MESVKNGQLVGSLRSCYVFEREREMRFFVLL